MNEGNARHRPLADRHAVITGGSRGIGLAIARALAADGASVSIMARDRERLARAASELEADGARVFACTIDVSDEASVAAAFAAARAAFGSIDVLVNNAGVAASTPFAKTSLAQFQQLLDINLKGVWLCTQAFAQELADDGEGGAHWRHVVNIASTAALKGYPYVSAYCAAKHGVLGLTRALAQEWARRRVTVNAVCPGYTETDIVAAAVANIRAKTGRDEAGARAALASSNPQGTLVTPEQVAHVVRSLVCAGGEAINGHAISVSGGEI